MPVVLVGVLAALAVLALWGVVESQWVRLGTREIRVEGLPAALDGFRILHISDLHLGAPSLAWIGTRRAAAWAEHRDLDLTVITGDLLSARRGRPALEAFLARIDSQREVLAVLGNHDVALTRDPFSRAGATEAVPGMRLLRDDAVVLTHAGVSVRVAGVDALSYLRGEVDVAELSGGEAFRILLSHYPTVVKRTPPAAFDLVLAGHMHGGQICVPFPGGKLRLAHPKAPYPEGSFAVHGGQTTLVVSRGLGTTFVPFRFFARPELTELVLRAPTLKREQRSRASDAPLARARTRCLSRLRVLAVARLQAPLQGAMGATRRDGLGFLGHPLP